MSGIQFPLDATNRRPSTPLAKHLWSVCASSLSSSLSQQINNEKNWRQNYAKHVNDLFQLMLKTPQDATTASQMVLDEVFEKFTFVRDTQEVSLKEAMQFKSDLPLTAVVKAGSDVGDSTALGVRFGDEASGSGVLVEDELVDELVRRCEAGEMEPDVIESIKQLNKFGLKKVQDALKDTYFVILGATSELCPLQTLLNAGLNIIAISRQSPKRQRALLEKVRNSTSGGSVTIPVFNNENDEIDLNDFDVVCNRAGADVLVDTPEIKNWLVSLYPGKRLVIGSYIYLDGANHVRASVAMDAIASGVMSARPDTCLMYIGTPAIVYPIPAASALDSIERYNTRPWWHSLTPLQKRNNTPTVAEKVDTESEDKEFYLFNGIINVQGPNYCLAKTLQHFRCIVAQNQCIVSINMAPTCTTDSVMHVPSVAKAVRGLRALPPLTYYKPETARDLMGLLVLYDFCIDSSTANNQVKLRNPLELFSFNGVHGGLWRSPYEPESTGTLTYLAGLLKVV